TQTGTGVTSEDLCGTMPETTWVLSPDFPLEKLSRYVIGRQDARRQALDKYRDSNKYRWKMQNVEYRAVDSVEARFVHAENADHYRISLDIFQCTSNYLIWAVDGDGHEGPTAEKAHSVVTHRVGISVGAVTTMYSFRQ